MALTEDLQIYADTYQLISRVIEVDRGICKIFKPTVGKKLTETALELFGHIETANRSTDTKKRAYQMEQFLIKKNLIVTLMRLCHDKGWVNHGLYSEVSYMLTTIGKQMTAWKNSEK
ncbi:MAG: four helix bundle protein [Prevotella sp.]|nr:four helix bundle protein [Candidatus Prevotella equi]